MPGSKRWFTYIDDYDVPWKLERDEQLTEAVNSTQNVALPQPGLAIISRGIEPRTLRYNRVDGQASKRVVMLSNKPADLEAAPTLISLNDGAGVVTYYLTSYIGERQRLSASIDTNQQDGDAELATIAP